MLSPQLQLSLKIWEQIHWYHVPHIPKRGASHLSRTSKGDVSRPVWEAVKLRKLGNRYHLEEAATGWSFPTPASLSPMEGRTKGVPPFPSLVRGMEGTNGELRACPLEVGGCKGQVCDSGLINIKARGWVRQRGRGRHWYFNREKTMRVFLGTGGACWRKPAWSSLERDSGQEGGGYRRGAMGL